MGRDMIAFITGPEALVENERLVCMDLRSAWWQLFGVEADFGPTGLGAVGCHFRTRDPSVRSVRVLYSASDDAVAHAIRLIKTKHKLDHVDVRGSSNAGREPPARPHRHRAPRTDTSHLAVSPVLSWFHGHGRSGGS